MGAGAGKNGSVGVLGTGQDAQVEVRIASRSFFPTMSHAGDLEVELLRGLWVMPLTQWILSVQMHDAGGTLLTGIYF